MALLDLRFGYFAHRGVEGAIDNLDAPHNQIPRSKIEQFRDWFFRNRRHMRDFMSPNSKASKTSFNIVSDNIYRNADQLEDLSKFSGHRFSVVVPDIKVDLLNKRAFEAGQTTDALADLFMRAEAFEVQIFNINDSELPLHSNILDQLGPSKFPHYLMDNAINSRTSLEKWHKRAN